MKERKKEKDKEPIRLREKKLKSGNVSLYLDYYRNGKREYEFLKVYLIPEKTREDKDRNKQTRQLANAIKAKRIVELQTGEYGLSSRHTTDALFYPYFVAMCQARARLSRSAMSNWGSCLKHLRAYDNNVRLTFADITPQWVQGFKDYLDGRASAWNETRQQRLAPNTKFNYFRRLKSCLRHAVEDKIIPVDPSLKVENFKAEESSRMYLTIEEVQRLVQTDCGYRNIRAAFLFSCLTGLRRSDIVKLTWGEVHHQGEFARIIFRQKKTSGQEYLDITPQAAELLGERGKDTDKVFVLPAFYSTNRVVQEWVLRAGINKKITFHCARHTFATMMLDLGTDIYTVSKLLGHRELSTTQIYAKVLDKSKQKAVSNIPNILHIE